MKEDKRRMPYNSWVAILGSLIILLFFAVGYIFGYAAITADQHVIAEKIYTGQIDSWSLENEYTSVYNKDAETEDDWRVSLMRIFTFMAGVVIAGFGIYHGGNFIEKRWWEKGYSFKKINNGKGV